MRPLDDPAGRPGRGPLPARRRIVPDPTAATARLRIDPADAAFLAGSLGRLPGADAHLAPVTVDLNGRIAVRAAARTDPAATAELVLSRSSYAGTPVRFGTDRNLLARALRLGFAEVEVGEPAAPLVCRGARATYAWQPLSPESTLESNPELTRIESDPRPPAAEPRTPEPPRAPAVPARGRRPRPTRAAPARPRRRPRRRAGLLALVREAESLHEALGAARTRSQRLVVALKRHRKQARLMAATIRSLRQLKLQEVAG